MRSQIFLSHNSVDKPLIHELNARLNENGVETWFDADGGLSPGKRWRRELEKALKDCTVFVYTVGPNGPGVWQEQEADVALDRASRTQLAVVPALLPGSDPADLPVFMRTYQAVDFREGLQDKPLIQLVDLFRSLDSAELPNPSQQYELPLPIANLYRNVRDVNRPQEQHRNACLLWVASLKMVTSITIGELVQRAALGDERRETIAAFTESILDRFSQPSLDSWLAVAEETLQLLADEAIPEMETIRRRFFEDRSNLLPRTAAAAGSFAPTVSIPVRDLLANLPNHIDKLNEHGIEAGEHSNYAELLLEAFDESIRTALARMHRRLRYVSELRSDGKGGCLVDCIDLAGRSTATRVVAIAAEESLSQLPQPKQVYALPADSLSRESLQSASDAEVLELRSLHPWVGFDAEQAGFVFLDQYDGKEIHYLSYESGDTQTVVAQTLLTQLKQRVRGELDAPTIQDVELPAGSKRTLGGFILAEKLGKGATGQVFRARQPSLNRDVALKKLLRPNDPKSVARFESEIRALGKVEHPNLVKVYSSQMDANNFYFAMELVHGNDLSSVFQTLHSKDRETLNDDWRDAITKVSSQSNVDTVVDSPQEVIAESKPDAASHTIAKDSYNRTIAVAMCDVCLAVQALHNNDVIHRDIKPANIMLSEDSGRAVLMDLGIAQLIDEQAGQLTQTNQFVGTYRYASPNQLDEPDHPDKRNDIYSIGATLWELLALTPLYELGDNKDVTDLELRDRIRHCKPVSIRKYRKGVPKDLEAIATKALEKDPDRRYRSAGEMADDLGRWLNGEPVHAHGNSLWYRIRKSIQQYPKTYIAAASVAVMLVLASFYHLYRVTHERNRALAARDDANHAVSTFLREVASDPVLRANQFSNLRINLLLGADKYYERLSQPDHQRLRDYSAKEMLQHADTMFAFGTLQWECGQKDLALKSFDSAASSISDAEKTEPGVSRESVASVVNEIELRLFREFESSQQINDDLEGRTEQLLLEVEKPLNGECPLVEYRVGYLNALSLSSSGKDSDLESAIAKLTNITSGNVDAPYHGSVSVQERIKYVVADAHGLLGQIQVDLAEHQNAIKNLTKAIEQYGEQETDVFVAQRRAEAISNLGLALKKESPEQATDVFKDAASAFESLADRQRDLGDLTSDHWYRFAECQVHLADLHHRADQRAENLLACERVLDGVLRLNKPISDDMADAIKSLREREFLWKLAKNDEHVRQLTDKFQKFEEQLEKQ